MEVDLFARDWNFQLDRFVSWFPQPQAWKIDAFSLNWQGLHGYALPPFDLIPICLSKIISDQPSLVLFTPYWSSQPWFPVLLDLEVEILRLVQPNKYLLTSAL